MKAESTIPNPTRRQSRPGRLAAILALVAVVLGVSLIGQPVEAQAPDPPPVDVAPSGEGCAPGAAVLVAVVTASPDLDRAMLVGDLAHQLATVRDREIHWLAGWAGAVFEPVSDWERVTPDRAPTLAALVPQAIERGEVAALDPTDLADQVIEQLDAQASRVSGETCSIVVLDAGDTGVDLVASDGIDVVALSTDRGPLVADLAGIAGIINGGTTDIEVVAACAQVNCEQGTAAIDLPPVLGGFALTVVLPHPEAEIIVDLPRGASFPVSGGTAGQISAGSFEIQTSWPAADVVRLQAEVSPSETDWPGTWTVSVVDPNRLGAEAVVITSVKPGIAPQFTGSVRLAEDRPVTITAEFTDQEGRLVDAPDALAAISLHAVASVSDGTELGRTELVAEASGTWSGRLELSSVPVVSNVTLGLVATLDVGRQVPVEVRTATVAEVLPAAVWPSADAQTIELKGDAGGQLTGSVTVTAGEGVDACAWIEAASVELGGTAAPVALAGGARSMASCATVPADTTVALPVTVDLSDVAPGDYDSTVLLAYSPIGDEAFETVEIALTIEALKPINVARRVQITVGMSLIALVVPLLALWLLDWIKARFRPSRRAVAAEAWIAVWSDGSIYRVDTDGSPLLLGHDDFFPAELPRSRQFEWRGFQLWVRNPTSPLTPPTAVVGSATGPVVASMGAVVDDDQVLGRVPLNLAPTWIFELQPDATRDAAVDPTAPDFYAAYGRIVVIRHAGADPVDLSELATLAQRVALTVRRSRTSAEGTAQEMLDFVEANVSMPRNLPRRHLDEPEPLVEADPPPGSPTLMASEDPYDFSDLAELFTEDHEPTGDEAELFEEGLLETSPSFEQTQTDISMSEPAPSTDPAEPAESARQDDPGHEEEPEEPADPRTSWARRAKPSWPSLRRDR